MRLSSAVRKLFFPLSTQGRRRGQSADIDLLGALPSVRFRPGWRSDPLFGMRKHPFHGCEA
jgi:hypothetical protein